MPGRTGELGQAWRQADAYTALGRIAFRREDYAGAEGYYQQSLLLVRETGNRDRIALMLALLGDSVLAQEDTQAAERHFQEALEMAVQIQADPVILRVLLGMAKMFAKGEQAERAVELLAFVQHHPAAEQSVKDRVELLYRGLVSEMSPDVIAGAFQEGKRKEVAAHLDLLAEAGYFSHSHTN